MTQNIEILVGDVNDVEARVYARYVGDGDGAETNAQIVVQGTLRGPYCERSRTLPAVIAFRDIGKPGMAEAIVPDPCIWSPELPHLYHADVAVRQGERVVADYHGTIGLCRGKHA